MKRVKREGGLKKKHGEEESMVLPNVNRRSSTGGSSVLP